MTRTVQELADLLGVDEVAARGLVAFLRAVRLCEFRGERPAPRGGKGPHVYSIPVGAGDTLRRLLERVED